jgi:hypothetical protein
MPDQMLGPGVDVGTEPPVGESSVPLLSAEDPCTTRKRTGRAPAVPAFRPPIAHSDREPNTHIGDTTLVEVVEASRLAQGLPSRVTDAAVLRRIGMLFAPPGR